MEKVCGIGTMKQRYDYSTGLLYVMQCGYNTTIGMSADWCGLSTTVMSVDFQVNGMFWWEQFSCYKDIVQCRHASRGCPEGNN